MTSLRPAAHMQKALVHLSLSGNNNLWSNRCSYVTLVLLIQKAKEVHTTPCCWLWRREGAAPSTPSLASLREYAKLLMGKRRKPEEPERGMCEGRWQVERRAHTEFKEFGDLGILNLCLRSHLGTQFSQQSRVPPLGSSTIRTICF